VYIGSAELYNSNRASAEYNPANARQRDPAGDGQNFTD
jgi:hypothetical protein